jgi:hypothetical protein
MRRRWPGVSARARPWEARPGARRALRCRPLINVSFIISHLRPGSVASDACVAARLSALWARLGAMTLASSAANRRPAPPARYEIAKWWEKNAYTAYPEHQCAAYEWQEPPYHWDFVIDLGEPSCFACDWYDSQARTYDVDDGYTNLRRIWDGSRLERAHIVPYALGGGNQVSNYLLLCKQCHRDSPDTTNPRFLLQWAQRRDSYGIIMLAKWKEAAKYLGVSLEQIYQAFSDHRDKSCIWDASRRSVPHFGAGISTASQVASLLEHAKRCEQKN